MMNHDESKHGKVCEQEEDLREEARGSPGDPLEARGDGPAGGVLRPELKDERIAERSNHSNLCTSGFCRIIFRVQEHFSEFFTNSDKFSEMISTFSRIFGEIPIKFHQNVVQSVQNSMKFQ